MSFKEDSKERCAAVMDRTKIQLATAYAPGTLFTFENNLVVCKAIPKKNYDDPTNIKNYTRSQILKNIEERARAWCDVAMRFGEKAKPTMCVDKDFLDNEHDIFNNKLDERLFGFVEPDRMGYEPTLLTMECSRCHRVKFFDNLKDFEKRSPELSNSSCDENNTSEKCDWRQMDIVFIHPNGNIVDPKPWVNELNQETGAIYRRGERCPSCDSTEVKLDSHSSQIGKRFFYCAKCKMKRSAQWLQNDEKYIRDVGGIDGLTIADVRMKAISCRANSVHYCQQDMVIDFGDSEILDQLSSTQLTENYVAQQFSLLTSKLSEEEIKQAVIQKLGEGKWNVYEQLKKVRDTMKSSSGNEAQIKDIDRIMQGIEQGWYKENILTNNSSLPTALTYRIRQRQEIYAGKYDPFRLFIEHAALLEKVVNSDTLNNGLRRFTPLDNLDNDVGPENQEELLFLNKRHRQILDSIGIETIGLVREFKIFHYSYGFTRVSPLPTVEYINGRTVPVRLNLFPKTSIDSKRKHPIFILNQNNEAIYVKLNEEHIRKWLTLIDVNESVSNDPIGLQYLMNVPDMNTFLDNLPGDSSTPKPQLSLALYTLLHTYAHHIMTAVSEFSGLGMGSLGEYIFPADLAFIVYRRGMTMDLGNLNSMLRNNAPAFLEHLANRRNLGCGSGSLCLKRGGACPDCILIPEVSCMAHNKLLSRSVLIGKDHPQHYGFNKRIPGFFDVVQGLV